MVKYLVRMSQVVGVMFFNTTFFQTKFLDPGSFPVFHAIYTKQYTMNRNELSSIKRYLYDMLIGAGKHDNDNYTSLMETLDQLNLRDYTLESYSTHLVGVLNDMYDLDDLAFDLGISGSRNLLVDGLNGQFWLWAGKNIFLHKEGIKEIIQVEKGAYLKGCYLNLRLPLDITLKGNYYDYISSIQTS